MAKKPRTIVEYLEVLERFDIPIEAYATKSKMQKFLEETLTEVTPKSVDGFWNAGVRYFEELAPAGVRPIVVEYPWGKQLRFAIKGQRGLFGPEAMMKKTGIKI
jgi:hypothetical protein